jgi:hypothetical protein
MLSVGSGARRFSHSENIRGSPDAMKYAMDNGLQLLRKPFHLQELYNAFNTALASGEFGQRSQGGGSC